MVVGLQDPREGSRLSVLQPAAQGSLRQGQPASARGGGACCWRDDRATRLDALWARSDPTAPVALRSTPPRVDIQGSADGARTACRRGGRRTGRSSGVHRMISEMMPAPMVSPLRRRRMRPMSLLVANGSSEIVGCRRSLECSLDGRIVISTRAETLRGRTLQRGGGRARDRVSAPGGECSTRSARRCRDAPRVVLDDRAVCAVDDGDELGEDGRQVGRVVEQLKQAAGRDRDVDVEQDNLRRERDDLRDEGRLRAEDRADAARRRGR